MPRFRSTALACGLLLAGWATGAIALDENVLRASLEGEANEELSRLRDAGKEYDNPKIYDYVQGVLDRISGEKSDYHVFLINSPAVIGYALSNRHIVLSAGLVARLESEAQLAMVLSHELAHIEKEHALAVKLNQIEREDSRSGGTFGSLLGRAGDLAVATSAISSITGGDASAVNRGVGTANTANVAIESLESSMAAAGPEGLGKELEKEADMKGVKLVKEAGYDVSVAIKSWEQLAKYSVNTDKRYLYGNPQALAERSKQTRKAAKKEKAGQGDGADSASYCGEVFEVMRWMATEDLDAKRYAAAEESITCALSADPDDPRSRYLNGRLLRDTARTTSNFREAIQEFQFVLEAIPDQGSTHRELGYTYTDVKEYDKALQHLQRYLDLKPEAEDARDVKAAIKAVTVLQRTSASQEDW